SATSGPPAGRSSSALSPPSPAWRRPPALSPPCARAARGSSSSSYRNLYNGSRSSASTTQAGRDLVPGTRPPGPSRAAPRPPSRLTSEWAPGDQRQAGPRPPERAVHCAQPQRFLHGGRRGGQAAADVLHVFGRRPRTPRPFAEFLFGEVLGGNDRALHGQAGRPRQLPPARGGIVLDVRMVAVGFEVVDVGGRLPVFGDGDVNDEGLAAGPKDARD